MNRLKAVGVLVALSSIAIVTVLTSPSARASVMTQTTVNHAGPVSPTAGVTCTLTTTTTESMPGNQSFDTALLMSNADGLSLVPSTAVPPGTTVDVATHDDYFYLNNVVGGTTIQVQALPDNAAAGNYNLGLDVYDQNLNLIFSDTDTSDFSASITFLPTYVGQIYIRVYQLNTAARCMGGYYSLRLTRQPPLPLPSFGYGIVMAGPDNLWPDWIGFNYRFVFTSPVISGKTELMRLAINASDLDDLPALGDRVRQIAAANSSVESFQIGNDPNLASAWGDPPDAHDYAQVLCTTFQNIRQVRPWASVVSGGLATTGRIGGIWNGHLGHDGARQDEREFLKELIDAGGGDCLDALGYNALGFGANYDAVPDVDGGTSETDCVDGRCFRSVEKVYAIMQSRGLNKPVFMTEVGWLIAPPSACLSDPRWQELVGQIVTPARQADNLVGAFRYARFNWPWLKAMFVYNLDFNMAPWYDECDPVRYYSVAGQPAFLAMGAMSKKVYHLYLPVMIR